MSINNLNNEGSYYLVTTNSKSRKSRKEEDTRAFQKKQNMHLKLNKKTENSFLKN